MTSTQDSTFLSKSNNNGVVVSLYLMVIKVGINGFGRIGRIVARACLQNPELLLSAINDPAITVEYVSYLIKFDSTHGKLDAVISFNDDEIVIDGHHIKVFHEKLPSSVPWHCADVQYVVEASGMFTSCEKASGHLVSNGVKRVIVTAPSVDIPMIILGVNDYSLSPECKVMSCASSTLYCLAPIIKVLEDGFGVEEGFVTSIHAMTPSLKLLDGMCLRGKHWRDHRSIHQNIIPASTGACKALGKILPQVKDKLSGLAFRVPIVNVSLLDLTIRLHSNTTLQEIVKSIKQASNGTLQNILRVSNEESVSSDFIGETRSCIFDENSSIQLKPNFFKFICWYENEFSYACRVVDTIIFSDKQSLEISNRRARVKHVSLRKQSQTQQSECVKKQEYIACKYKQLRNHFEKASCISRDTGVKIRPAQTLFIREPLSGVISPTTKCNKDTKTDEKFKIWNDNTCSVFQSPIGIPPQTLKYVESNSQARLENVKREFTKMVSITEDLLKKSYSSQSSDKTMCIDATKGLNVGIKEKEVVSKIKSGGGTNRPFEEYGESQSFADFSNASQAHVYYCNNKYDAKSLTSYDRDDSENNVSNSAITKDRKHFGDIIESENVLIVDNNTYLANTDKDRQYERLVKQNKNNEFKRELTKTVTTLVDGLSHNEEVKFIWNNNNINATTCINNERVDNGPRDNYKISSSNSDQHLLFEMTTNGITEIKNSFKNEEGNLSNKINKNNLKKDVQIIDNELRRNIEQVENSFNAESEIEIRNEDYITKADDIHKGNGTRHITLERKYYCTPQTVSKVSENIIKCDPIDNKEITINNYYKKRHELYDKLESASESGSNNSFEINERKSETILLTDLTTSSEDLGRLDKICRIIEVSDELSDKMFSALDDDKCTELKNKSWSFKDFCARIKLDDFCDKVFGGSST